MWGTGSKHFPGSVTTFIWWKSVEEKTSFSQLKSTQLAVIDPL